MDSNKFNNIDLDTIMKIAQTGENNKKVGGQKYKKEEHDDIVLEWMKDLDLREGPVKVLSSELYICFQGWLKQKKIDDMGLRKFGRIMSKLLRKTRGKRGQLYLCNKNPIESVANVKKEEKE